MDQFPGARLRESCNETVTCIGKWVFCHMEESNSYCRCEQGYVPHPDDPHSCAELVRGTPELGTDPTMIGVVVGLALMSVTICIVMRLFAKARFAENRTIFNTANPRLMNVSLKTGTDAGKRSAAERDKFRVEEQRAGAPRAQNPKDEEGVVEEEPKRPE